MGCKRKKKTSTCSMPSKTRPENNEVSSCIPVHQTTGVKARAFGRGVPMMKKALSCDATSGTISISFFNIPRDFRSQTSLTSQLIVVLLALIEEAHARPGTLRKSRVRLRFIVSELMRRTATLWYSSCLSLFFFKISSGLYRNSST